MSPAVISSNLPRESAPWGRWVGNQLSGLQRAAKLRDQGETNNNKQQNSSINLLARQVSELNEQAEELRGQNVLLADQISKASISEGGYSTHDGFALAEGWNTYAQMVIPAPVDKLFCYITAIGNGAALDKTSAGATSSYARIGIRKDGEEEVDYSVQTPCSKDAGAAVVNNVFNVGYGGYVATNATGFILVDLQFKPNNPLAFSAAPSNFAALTVTAIFSNK